MTFKTIAAVLMLLGVIALVLSIVELFHRDQQAMTETLLSGILVGLGAVLWLQATSNDQTRPRQPT
jgi:hypothetical protein